MSDIAQELIERVENARVAGSTLEIVGGGSKKFIGREVMADGIIDVSGVADRDEQRVDPVATGLLDVALLEGKQQTRLTSISELPI